MYREAKGFLTGELERRANDAGRQVTSTAGHLRTIADQLRGDDFGRGAAGFADRGADTLERFGQYLEDSSAEQLLGDAERFGQERPWAIIAAGVALGLAGSRMIKASASQRYRGDPDGGSYSGVPMSSDAAPLEARANASRDDDGTYEHGA